MKGFKLRINENISSHRIDTCGIGIVVNIGVDCFEKEIIEKFRFFTTVQNKRIVYKKRWYFRCSAFIHNSINNLPIVA